MINGLGISELLHIFISAAGKDIRPGAIGKQIPGFRVRVVNEDFEDTVAGEIGQMIVKGPERLPLSRRRGAPGGNTSATAGTCRAISAGSTGTAISIMRRALTT